jgi:aromatic ring-opening dioxygenase catalytic subunit (LigB family)
MSNNRMPVAYVPHGGGPWPWVDIGFPKHELEALSSHLRDVRKLPKTPPKALLVISAHWEEPVPTVMTAARPPMLYDYYGFPPESYTISWPAPGDPKLAARVQTLLGKSGFDTAADPERGFDHGTFVPLKLTYPEADVPTVQLSLKKGLDAAEHLAMGRALAPLRNEGVFILGSGMSYHNMGNFRLAGRGDTAAAQRARSEADAFDSWLRETVVQAHGERDGRLSQWSSAPGARSSHPREEHLLPLMVIAGAAMEDGGTVAYNDTLMGFKSTGVQFV